MEKIQKQLELEIAKEFSTRLAVELPPQAMEAMVSANRKNTTKDICVSNDFCDPNPIMLDSLKHILLFHGDQGLNFEDLDNAILTNVQTTIWNNAWEIAIENDFFFNPNKEG